MNEISRKQQAWALYRQNRPQDAIQLCEEIGRSETADAELFYLLGSCYGMLGKFRDAATEFQNSLRIRPGNPQSLLALSKTLTRLGRVDEAIESYRTLLELKPNSAMAHCALADLLCLQKLTAEAREHYENARELRPELGAPYIGLGALAGNDENNPEKALALFRQAVELEPENAAYRCSLGMALSENRCNEEAHFQYREALRLAPEYPDAIGGIARLYSLEGEYDKALEQIKQLSDRNIPNANAAIAFTIICKHTGHCEEAVTYAETALQNKMLNTRSLGALHMHTARALDSMDHYDAAWQHFVAGNRATATLYDTANHKLATDRMMEIFSHAGLMSFPRSGIDSKRPIFIIGMPRSGTSLVEQILAAHPDVYGGGELTYISDLRLGMPELIGSDKSWPECIHDMTKENANQLASRYLQQINELSGTAKRITDKMPHNFNALGLIQLLFPEAQVIHCRRDPMDTSLSIYFQNFLEGHDYAKNLYHIGAHYHQYMRLMEHWKHFLSIPILDVQYEELVNDPEPVVRRMLDHCKLEWNEACLEFHKVKRFVNTASFDQVRQPMYTRSVARWKHYDQYLDNLRKGLELGY